MKTVSYEFLQAEQAWLIVSDQLQHRSNVLAKSISHLERNPQGLPMASRLTILRYHLKMSLRQLSSSTNQPVSSHKEKALTTQWQHIHQLFFLLRQIDSELGRATSENLALRVWIKSFDERVYRSALVHVN